MIIRVVLSTYLSDLNGVCGRAVATCFVARRDGVNNLVHVLCQGWKGGHTSLPVRLSGALAEREDTPPYLFVRVGHWLRGRTCLLTSLPEWGI